MDKNFSKFTTLNLTNFREKCYSINMDQNFEKRLSEMETKINEIYVSVEKTRKYFLWTMIVTLVVFVLPIIGLMLFIPSFISTYTEALSGF